MSHRPLVFVVFSQLIELAVAKHNIEQHVSPEIAQARDATRKALKEAEHGWQRAIDKIAERANLTKGPIRGDKFFSTR
jgi:hypothetical protein